MPSGQTLFLRLLGSHRGKTYWGPSASSQPSRQGSPPEAEHRLTESRCGYALQGPLPGSRNQPTLGCPPYPAASSGRAGSVP
ncbi:hypothetical protein NDU88_006530 [Pleurodeles waltl]|uniref:Uncharacterized protein n=1 Tax=Pleurodeles waltl TaxID=8319 RepID=A0AAV7PIL7_PLEWA|nr:hypothetical protein NDU88_006530 [Pleurodeles waltl]